MAVKPVLHMGHPLLLQKAQPVSQFDTPELHQLLQDMKDTMAMEEGVGLAAPQIGTSIQMIIFGFENNSRYPAEDAIPFTVLINPVITPLTHEQEDGWEGCLSLPGMSGLVPRYTKINYQGFDIMGKPLSKDVDGFHARVVQHECDHLNGVLYPFRIRDLRQFGFNDALSSRN